MKKLLFVSDIAGTISGAVNSDYESLAEQLLLLKDKYEADEIIFSLCTADSDPDYLISYYHKIESIFKKYDISMGRQYYAGGYFEDGKHHKEWAPYINGSMDKVQTIIEYAKKLQVDNEISAIYYADDTMSFNSANGYIESELDDKVYYHFINVGNNLNISSYNYSASSKENIEGLIQALNFHLGKEDIRIANQTRIEKEKDKLKKEQEENERRMKVQKQQKEEEENLRETQRKKIELERLEKEKRRLEMFQSKQFSDIASGQSSRDYNKWIKKVKGMFFNKTQSNIIFSRNYERLLMRSPIEWIGKPNIESYSLHQIIEAFNSMDQLTVILLSCDKVGVVNKRNNDVYSALSGFDKSDNLISIAPMNHNNKTYLSVDDDHIINMMEYLMRKERIPLYSLVDTIISFHNIYYGDDKPGFNLRKNSNVNEDLVKRIIKVRDSEQYNNISDKYILNKYKGLSLIPKNKKEKKEENDLPF